MQAKSSAVAKSQVEAEPQAEVEHAEMRWRNAQGCKYVTSPIYPQQYLIVHDTDHMYRP